MRWSLAVEPNGDEGLKERDEQENEATEAHVAIVVTAEEAAALERAIRECTTNTGSSDVKLLKAIAEKLKNANSRNSVR
jgi:hypothetical protein